MSGGRAWTTREVRRLLEMRAQGLKAWSIGQELGRTENAIYSFIKYKAVGAKGQAPPPKIGEWTPAAVNRLRELASDGATAEEAAAELCRALYAIRNKASREGISFARKARDSSYRLEREGNDFKRNAIKGSSELRDAILAKLRAEAKLPSPLA